MKKIYSPENSIEATLLSDLLAQHDIQSKIDGLSTHDAWGGLMGVGALSLQVNFEDVNKAESLIQEWLLKKTDTANTSDTIKTIHKHSSSTLIFTALIAGILGATASFFLTKPKINEYTTDFNNDKKIDQVITYISDKKVTFAIDQNNDGKIDGITNTVDGRHISKKMDVNFDGEHDSFYKFYSGSEKYNLKMDANFDGELDSIFHTNAYGQLESSKSDLNFDNTFETFYTYEHGIVKTTTIDIDGDGIIDQKSTFENGALKKHEYIDTATKLVIKEEVWNGLQQLSSKIDTDKDGAFDIQHKYDDIGEIKSTLELTQ